MTALFNKVFLHLRIVLTLTLILVISFKTVAVIVNASEFKKELTTTDNDDEKKAETDSKTEKEKEFAKLNLYANSHKITYTTITHNTAYYINYSYFFFHTITIPPPDFNLQQSV